MNICAKCGGELFQDRTSARDLFVRQVVGVRIRCLAGCTDRWIRLEEPPPVVRPADRDEQRGHYPRRIRTYQCPDCQGVFTTTGTHVLVCPACRRVRNRVAEQLRHRRRPGAASG